MVLPPKKKKSPEIPVFPTILVVLPPESFSRDPSFSHYLGGPSSKKKKILKRSQLFPLFWGSFPPQKKISRDPSFSHYFGVPSSKTKKNSQEIPVFPTILGFLPPPTKKISRDPSFSHYLGVSSQKKKNPQKSQFFLLSGGPSPQKNLQRSQFFPLSWWSFPPPPKKKKSPEIPVFPTILVVLPPESFSRDPSFSHYLGGPSPKKFLKRSQLFPLGVLPPPPKKKSQEIPAFPTIVVVLPPSKKKKILQRSHFFPLSWGSFPRDPSFSHYLGGPSPLKKKKISRNPTFSHYFGGPSPKTFSRDPTFSHYLGGPPPKKKTKKTSGLGLILLYVVWYLSKILRGHIVPHFLRSPLSPLSSFVYLI